MARYPGESVWQAAGRELSQSPSIFSGGGCLISLGVLAVVILLCLPFHYIQQNRAYEATASQVVVDSSAGPKPRVGPEGNSPWLKKQFGIDLDTSEVIWDGPPYLQKFKGENDWVMDAYGFDIRARNVRVNYRLWINNGRLVYWGDADGAPDAGEIKSLLDDVARKIIEKRRVANGDEKV